MPARPTCEHACAAVRFDDATHNGKPYAEAAELSAISPNNSSIKSYKACRQKSCPIFLTMSY